MWPKLTTGLCAEAAKSGDPGDSNMRMGEEKKKDKDSVGEVRSCWHVIVLVDLLLGLVLRTYGLPSGVP